MRGAGVEPLLRGCRVRQQHADLARARQSTIEIRLVQLDAQAWIEVDRTSVRKRSLNVAINEERHHWMQEMALVDNRIWTPTCTRRRRRDGEKTSVVPELMLQFGAAQVSPQALSSAAAK